MNEKAAFEKALEESPTDKTTLLVYSDWLDEHGEPMEALKMRVKAGISKMLYKLRRRSDGLFSESPRDYSGLWGKEGRVWNHLPQLRGHMTRAIRRAKFLEHPWPDEDLEIVVFEVKTTEVCTLPLKDENGKKT